jgi:FkbM family methyltransferase
VVTLAHSDDSSFECGVFKNMNESMTIKGRFVWLAARVAMAGPWRTPIERVACIIGHRFPTSRTVISFCRHFGGLLLQREGERFERVVVFDSGGKMSCGGEKTLGPTCAMYYFLGTITNQDEDERPLAKLLSLAVRRGDTLFDIGANVGFYSFFLGPLCGTSGAVHAFEANPLLIPHLRRSAELNKPEANIVINAVAVGKEANKTMKLYDPERIGGSSLYKLDWLDSKSSVTVPLTTIDEYRRANQINRVDVVKIDIEGAELDAFKGMEETFKSCPPALIVCELALLIAPGDRQTGDATTGAKGGYAMEIIEFLRAKGYEARYIRDSDGLVAGLVERRSLERLSQNLINTAFVRPNLAKVRPELFCA